MNLTDSRKIEQSKYALAYRNPRYRMKKERRRDAVHDLKALPSRGSYLDVACGQGDMLKEAQKLGFDPVLGTEIVAQLVDGKRVIFAEVHALPFRDKTFDVATLFDVIEHLIPGDDEAACRELQRVARKHIVLTANNKRSHHGPIEFHINRRPYRDWNRLFRQWFSGEVTWIKGERHYVSEAWRIDL